MGDAQVIAFTVTAAVLTVAPGSILFDHMRRFLLKSIVRRWLDGLCGLMLIGFGARLALERR